MNKALIKNILFVVFVPTSLVVIYFSYQFFSRKQKEKKILEEVKNRLDKNKNKVIGHDENIITAWKKALSELKLSEFNSFFNYFIITIPVGKVNIEDDKDKSKNHMIWTYEKTNPEEFKKVADKAIKDMSGKEIEKLFHALSV